MVMETSERHINYNSGSHTNAGRVQVFNKYNDQLGLDLTGSQSNEFW